MNFRMSVGLAVSAPRVIEVTARETEPVARILFADYIELNRDLSQAPSPISIVPWVQSQYPLVAIPLLSPRNSLQRIQEEKLMFVHVRQLG